MANGFGRGARTVNIRGGGQMGQMQQFGLAANLLATPARIEAAHHQAAMDRAILGRLGVSDAEQRTLVPEPPLSLPGGMAGKALSGLGTVGSILTSAMGQPIAAPRVPLGQLLQVEALRPGFERRRILGKTAARVGAAKDLEDDELIKSLVVDFLRVGDAGTAAGLLKHRGTSKATQSTLNGALARAALRGAGAAAGTPRGDQAIIEMFAGFEGLKVQFKKWAELSGPLAARQAEVDALSAAAKASATKTAQLSANTHEQFRKLRLLLPRAREAVEGRMRPDGTKSPGLITATGWTDSMMQGGRLHTARTSQWMARNVLRMDVDQQMSDDIKMIQDLRAFAGAFIKGAQLDTGKLSDKDIDRAMPSLPDLFATRMEAISALNIWEGFVNDLAAMDLDSELADQIEPIIKRLGDWAEESAKKGTEASGLTPGMVDDFSTPEAGVTGSREQERLNKILERMEQKYGGQE
jgi:hypothetical protein